MKIIVGLSIALLICASLGAAFEKPSSAKAYAPKRMADGKYWTTRNLSLKTAASYCYDDRPANCLKYGRLYTWESARQVCQSLGAGWRLPSEYDWRQLAKQFGGIHDDSAGGKVAYQSLMTGGRSGFKAVLGGNRDGGGQYARLEAHGFYWTSTEDDSANAQYYNFAHGGLTLYLQTGGEKVRAFAVRCVR